MRIIFILFFFACVACHPKESNVVTEKSEPTVVTDTIIRNNTSSSDTAESPITYGNERFREVTVTKTGDHTFLVKGQGRFFEAAFSWVIEDGHDEIQSGNQMTDAGAPEWGKFSFEVKAPKKDPNSTLHIILFESSPKDGSRQGELPILLY
jgi:hypothetical protein